MRPGGVRDLQGAHILLSIAADDLSISVFDRRHVVGAESSLDKSFDDGTFADTAGAENSDPIIIALFWHGVRRRRLKWRRNELINAW